jgi:hypothetical protein
VCLGGRGEALRIGGVGGEEDVADGGRGGRREGSNGCECEFGREGGGARKDELETGGAAPILARLSAARTEGRGFESVGFAERGGRGGGLSCGSGAGEATSSWTVEEECSSISTSLSTTLSSSSSVSSSCSSPPVAVMGVSAAGEPTRACKGKEESAREGGQRSNNAPFEVEEVQYGDRRGCEDSSSAPKSGSYDRKGE